MVEGLHFIFRCKAKVIATNAEVNEQITKDKVHSTKETDVILCLH